MRRKKITARELAGLRPYHGWTQEALETEADRVNASRGGESQEAFIDRLLADCSIAETPARLMLAELFDLRAALQHALLEGKSRAVHELGQAVRAHMTALGLDRRTKTREEKDDLAEAIQRAWKNAERVREQMPQMLREEALLTARTALRRSEVEEAAARASMTYEQAMLEARPENEDDATSPETRKGWVTGGGTA